MRLLVLFITLFQLYLCKADSLTVLLTKEEADVGSLNIFTLQGIGAVATINRDSLILLDSPNLDIVNWGKGNYGEKIIACGGNLYSKDYDSLCILNQNKPMASITKFDTIDFNIFEGTDSTFFVVQNDTLSSSVFEINPLKNSYRLIFNAIGFIKKISSNKRIFVILIDNSLFVLNDQFTPRCLYRDPGTLNDVVFTPYGLITATDHEIFHIPTSDKIISLGNIGARRLWWVDWSLYIETSDGNLVVIDNLQDFISENLTPNKTSSE